MFNIDYDGNHISISGDISKLKGYIKNQLIFFGFRNDGKQLIVSLNEHPTSLSDCLEYITMEGLEFEISQDVSQLYEKIKINKQNINELLINGKNFKNGIYDKTDLRKFNEFSKNNLIRELREHQLKSSYHLYKIKNGANFSVPGSGKTSVVLNSYQMLKNEDKVNKLFVVGPPSCFDPWIDEYKYTFGVKPKSCIVSSYNKNQRFLIYEGSIHKDTELFLISFNSVHIDRDYLIQFFKRVENNFYFVVDEAHYIKKIGGEWSTSILMISPFSEYKVILTGTPTPRDYSDIINMFDFLYPNNVLLDDDKRETIIYFSKNNQHDKVKEIIDELISPLFYRVRKKDLGLKPQIFHEPELIIMNPIERKVYDFLINKLKILKNSDSLMMDTDFLIRVIRSRVMRVRQVLSYTKLLSTMLDDYDEDLIRESDIFSLVQDYDNLEIPAKILRLKEIIYDKVKSNKKVVVWSNFIKSLELINLNIGEMGIGSEMIYGGVPYSVPDGENFKDVITRSKIINEFKNPNSDLMVLVANPGACAESISLHKVCQDSIYYDLSYNCAQYVQSLDRIHRVGGSEEKESHYYFLHYDNTVEHKIKSNLDEKKKRMETILDQDFPIYHDNLEFEDEFKSEYESIFNKDG